MPVRRRSPRFALVAAVAAVGLPAQPGNLREAHEAYLNREFVLAERAAESELAARPDSLAAHLLLVKSRLYGELARLRLAGTRAFRGDRLFNSRPRPKRDPVLARRVLAAIERAALLCSHRLGVDGADTAALHALAQLHALRAAHEMMLQRSYFRALASGRTGKELSYRVGRQEPEFADGLLVAGVYEYLVGSLPWAAKVIVAIRGHRGGRKRGFALIAEAAGRGESLRDEAQLLLALAERRERRYSRAARLFEELAGRFPRAFTYQLEAADLYESAGQRPRALALFRSAKHKREHSLNGFERITAAMARALDRRIDRLERDLARSG